MIKQIILIGGHSIVAFVKGFDQATNLLIVDCPMKVERFFDEDGNLRLFLFPWLDMADPIISTAIRADTILGVHAASSNSVAFYLQKVREYAPNQKPPFDLDEWDPAEAEATAN